MNFTHEHEEFRRTVARFVDEEINPHCDAWEAEQMFPAHKLFKKMGDLGLLGVSRDESCGGLELGWEYEMILAEELGRCRASGIPMAIGVQTNMATPALANFGSDEQKEEWLKPTYAGDMVGSIGVSEPNAGSDVASIKTTARKDGDDYIINGSKMWITNAYQADWICLLANTSDGAGEGNKHSNKSLIIVPLDAKGVDRSTRIEKIGMKSSDTCQIFFDNVRVPRRNLIGAEGQGFTYQMQQFQEERLWLAAQCLKALDSCVNETINYARERKIFGGSVLDNQWVHFQLAEVQTEIEALRSLVYRAVDELNAGRDATLLASMAKLKAGRLCRTVPDTCLQFWGGQGFTWDNVVSRYYRDLRLMPIGGGADEVMMRIIAKMTGTAGNSRG